MALKIIGLVIGILILCFGVYYLVKEKEDKESKKIYSIVSAVGAKAGHKVDALKASDKVCFTVFGNETIKEEAWAGKAAQMFEIEIEHMSGKEVQEK